MYPAAHLEFLTQFPSSPDRAPTSSTSSSTASSSTSTSSSSSPKSHPSSSAIGSASSNKFSSSTEAANLSVAVASVCGWSSMDKPSKLPRRACSNLCRGICKWEKASFDEGVDSFFNRVQVKTVLEQRRVVASCLRNLLHFGKLFSLTSDKVQERKLFEFLELLVNKFDNRNIALQKGLLAKFFPNDWVVKFLGFFQSNVQVVTFYGKFKSGLRIFNKLQCNFRISLSLQVADNVLTHEVRSLDNSKHLIEILVHQCFLESVFSRVNGHNFHLALSVQTETLSA
ncbi:hypothetical protein OGATHE_002102 [Ogataea polymorpha]|uniref:Uncharacterized protein n=1 Tax=Ogataea polymorpha TaxID=460523 RepID=A0A9P8PLK7_9ASCO|nr:hypothetical protein OGATHE_002102 [Ogataea polymorpha]